MRLPILAALSAAALVACGSRGGTTQMDFRRDRDGKGTALATLGGDRITVEEVQRRLEEMSPYARARYQTPEQKKEFVDGMARFEVLAQEALRRGLQNDRDVVETAKKVMVQKLIQQELDPKSAPVSDAELADYYEKHKTDYVKPEMLRLSEIFFAAPKNDPQRAAKRAQAEKVLAQAKELQPLDFGGFARLARQYSEDPRTKPLDGDMRFLSTDDIAKDYGPEVAQAGSAFKLNGELSPVLDTEKGFYIVKLQSRQPALNLTLDQVRAQLQGRIQNERRQQRFAQFVDELKAKAGYHLDDAALSQVQVDLKAPTKESRGVPPGILPSTAGMGPP